MLLLSPLQCPRRVAREVFIPHDGSRGVFPGFITYIDAREPMLLHRFGRMDGADAYDDFVESVSTDNGRRWSEPVPRLRSTVEAGGRRRYAENAAFFDARSGFLLTLATRSLYVAGELPGSTGWRTESRVYDPSGDRWSEPVLLDASVAQAFSFSFPLQLSTGRVLIPTQVPRLDERGQRRVLPGYWTGQSEARVLIGDEPVTEAGMNLRPSGRVGIDEQKSSRGLCEPTVAELSDGRVVMICRGDNGYFPERPGYKWVSYSEDGGETWGEAQPLRGCDGRAYESSATGSALIRSEANGRLYWIGNLCADGERANGGWPRSPLHIAEVCEDPFGLIPESIVEIDRRGAGDSDRTQLSNFRFYQDRASGEIVLLLTRFGEEDAQQHRRAHYYRYRIAV